MNNYTITIAFYESMIGYSDITPRISKWYATMHEIALTAEGQDPKEALDNLMEMYDNMQEKAMPIALHHAPHNSLDPNLVIPEEEEDNSPQ